MLRNFDNRLTADVIQALRAMGHGDDLVIADTNFPSDSVARQVDLGGERVVVDRQTVGDVALEGVVEAVPAREPGEHPLQGGLLLPVPTHVSESVRHRSSRR